MITNRNEGASKKIFAFFVTCMMVFLLAPVLSKGGNCFASDAGYETLQYDIDIDVHSNNVYTVTEHRKVNFTEYRHGIKRSIPNYFSVMLDGTERTYKTPIKNTWVDGDPYEMESEDGNRIFKIGDADQTIIGEKDYTLGYDIDYGDDRVDAYDYVYHNLIGSEEDCYIDSVNFTITFDKDVDLNKDNCVFYAGGYGSTEGNVQYQINGNTITGSAQNLAPGESLTADITLPADYYEGTRKYRPIIPIICFVGMIVVLFLVIRKVLSQEKDDIVETVEFYPPEGITSADVGYIVDESADDKDILSLFLWFADQGYMEIEEIPNNHKDMIFRKKKNPGAGCPKYAATFFSGLFAGKNEIHTKDFSDHFYDSVQTAKSTLGDEFVGKKQLEDASGSGMLYLVIGILIMILGTTFCAEWDFGNLIFAGIEGVIAFVFGVFLQYNYRNRYFIKAGRKIITMVIGIGVLAFSILINWIIMSEYPNLGLTVLLGILGGVIAIFSARMGQFSVYKREMIGKLLGLKTFIKTAELERINTLVEENPQYFFHILPYAYVFNLTDKWVKQFESLVVEPPSWYSGNTDAFSTYYFMRCMNRTYHNTQSSMSSVSAERSRSSSDGGGGFSGGGGGGGGSSSW